MLYVARMAIHVVNIAEVVIAVAILLAAIVEFIGWAPWLPKRRVEAIKPPEPVQVLEVTSV